MKKEEQTKDLISNILHVQDIEVHDPVLKAERDRIASKQKANALFFSISDTFKFVAGLCMTVGMGIVMPAIVNASAGGIAGIVSAVTVGAPAVGLAIIGAAVLAMGVAVGSGYISSRFYHGAYADSSELNAQHTAKYLVKELEAKAACIQHEHPENCRADGKQWQQVVGGRKSSEASIGLTQ